MSDLYFVIPTCRIEHVATTIRKFADNFERHGHSIPMVVFDDSERSDYAEFLTGSAPDLYYVGREEKVKFIDQLTTINDTERNALIRKIFGRGYGGNRNVILAYLQGDDFISMDDDMKPHGLYNKSQDSLTGHQIAKGSFVLNPSDFYERRDDIVTAYLHFLGKKVKDVQDVVTGEKITSNISDSTRNMTNIKIEEGTTEFFEVNGASVNPDATIKFCRSYITKSPDIDARDCIDNFLDDPRPLSINGISFYYTLHANKPAILTTDWKFTPASTAFHNDGLPPFIPGDLRYEDFIVRVWIARNADVASSITDIANSHYKNPFRRLSIAGEYFNEVVANFTKNIILAGVNGSRELYIHEDFDIKPADVEPVIEEVKGYYREAWRKAQSDDNKAAVYTKFCFDLKDEFEQFSTEKVRSYIERRAREEVKLINRTFHLWPSLMEDIQRLRAKGNLPMQKIE